MTAPAVDVVILGGGIAGLWLLARLERSGHSAVLLENRALGAGQTLASQGIIHGGLKYALDLKLGEASAALADMPARWRACLAGSGEVDLGGLVPAAEHHLFWARRTLAGRIAGFFGSRLLQGRVDALPPASWPAVLNDPAAVGAVYALDEMVLDVPALLQRLARPRLGRIRRIAGAVTAMPDATGVTIRGTDAAGAAREIRAGTLVAAAGAGNADLLAQLGMPASAAQVRPLQMVLVANAPAPLWAHCFDASDKPRVTVTTHARADGALVWYVGGQIAEGGVALAAPDLIAACRAEFATLLPRLDLSACRFATLRVDRAEGATADGTKPDGPVLRRAGRVVLAWPTKLALAPMLSDRVLADLPPPAAPAAPLPEDWSPPDIAAPPWETASWS